MLAPEGELILDTFVLWEALYENNEVDVKTHKVELPSGEWIEIGESHRCR